LKRQLFSLTICILLIFSFSINTIKSADADGTVKIDLKSRGTFLRAEEFQGSPSGGSPVEEPTIIDLVAQGYSEGDSITISYSGEYHYRAFWDGAGVLAETYSGDEIPLLGLFSSSKELNSIDDLNRVPGAINYGKDVITENTYFQIQQTDIPEDFRIEPPSGDTITIPEGAKYLFLCVYDGFYPDNVGDIQITIQGGEQSAFPIQYIIILAIALCAGIMLIFLLTKRKKKKNEKTLEANNPQ
jgi:hypothetical protein